MMPSEWMNGYDAGQTDARRGMHRESPQFPSRHHTLPPGTESPAREEWLTGYAAGITAYLTGVTLTDPGGTE